MNKFRTKNIRAAQVTLSAEIFDWLSQRVNRNFLDFGEVSQGHRVQAGTRDFWLLKFKLFITFESENEIFQKQNWILNFPIPRLASDGVDYVHVFFINNFISFVFSLPDQTPVGHRINFLWHSWLVLLQTATTALYLKSLHLTTEEKN